VHEKVRGERPRHSMRTRHHQQITRHARAHSWGLSDFEFWESGVRMSKHCNRREGRREGSGGGVEVEWAEREGRGEGRERGELGRARQAEAWASGNLQLISKVIYHHIFDVISRSTGNWRRAARSCCCAALLVSS